MFKNVIVGQSGGPTAVIIYVPDELIHYIRPLIQAELSPVMVDGLPGHYGQRNSKNL